MALYSGPYEPNQPSDATPHFVRYVHTYASIDHRNVILVSEYMISGSRTLLTPISILLLVGLLYCYGWEIS